MIMPFWKMSLNKISNSDWGTEFIKRLEDQKTPPLTNQEKDISDWEETW